MSEIAPTDPRPELDPPDDEANTEPDVRLLPLGDGLYAYQVRESGDRWRTVELFKGDPNA